jgi:DNA-damage-inducible protein J
MQVYFLTFQGMLTMSASKTYQIRLNEKEKEETFAVFNNLGVTPAQAIKLFFKQVRITQSIPFPINIPNAETQKVFAETDAGINLNTADSVEDLFNKLGI